MDRAGCAVRREDAAGRQAPALTLIASIGYTAAQSAYQIKNGARGHRRRMHRRRAIPAGGGGGGQAMTYLRSARRCRQKRRQPCSAATKSLAGAIHSCDRVSGPEMPRCGQSTGSDPGSAPAQHGESGHVLVVLHGLGIWLSHWGSHGSRRPDVESQVEGLKGCLGECGRGRRVAKLLRRDSRSPLCE